MTVRGDAITTHALFSTCAQEAAQVLARLFAGCHTAVTAVEPTTTSALADACGARAVVVAFSVSGAAEGAFALVMSEAHARALAKLLVGGGEETLSARQLDALQEVGNIGVSAFLNALARLVGKACLPSVPSVAYEDASRAVGNALAGHTDLRAARMVLTPPHMEVALVVAR